MVVYFFRVVPTEGENSLNTVFVVRKRGNTDQLRGEFAGENWGRRLSPLPARRKSLLLRATPPLRGLACWWWWREEKNKTLARSIPCIAQSTGGSVYFIYGAFSNWISVSSSSSQSISLFNGSTCSQVQQLSRPIQLDSSSRSAPRSATCLQSIPSSTSTETSASKSVNTFYQLDLLSISTNWT